MTAPVAVLAVLDLEIGQLHGLPNSINARRKVELINVRAAVAELIEVLGDIVKADDAALLQLASIGMKPAAGDPAVALTERARVALARVGAAP